MTGARIIEEKIADLYPEQEIRCPVHLSIGQEAVAVGVCAALGPQDYVFSGHRSHGHYLARGGSLKGMLAEPYGRATGCAGGIGGSMHLADPTVGFLGATAIVASTIPIAVGAALSAAMRAEDRISVAFFGEGATEEGVFHESMSFAALKRLPVVFVCENNLYSVHSPLSVRQPAGREVVELAGAHGIEGLSGDGNDVLAVERLARRAAEKARGGGGPTFLELKTYRLREHCGPNHDDGLGYRPEAEVREWKEKCPVARFGAALIAEGGMDGEEVRAMEERVRDEIEEAILFARRSPFPGEDSLFDHLYAP